ncbi:alpha-2-macroglobulin-like [Convolutriloba macropyga]|uniref:alpha-2-macroglobulin-like n=1 Tax=Convolutriloba macropyga TaxID=536237 RepID=UPI003F51CF96
MAVLNVKSLTLTLGTTTPLAPPRIAYLNLNWMLPKSTDLRLSCFVVRTFAEAENGGYANIADDDLMMTYEFLLHNSRIRSDGYVVENGVVLHSDMQGGSAGPETLAAYLLLSVSQAPQHLFIQFTTDQNTKLDQVSTFVRLSLQRAVDNSDADSYLLALGGVALYDYMVKKGLDPQQDPLLISVRDRILALKDESELICGNIFWTRGVSTSTEGDVNCTCKPDEPKFNYYTWEAPPPKMTVEATAYAVAFLSKMENDQTSIDDKLVTQRAVRWLGCEQKSTGGYQYTQDTVTAYYGMSLHTENQQQTDLNVKVTKKVGNGARQTVEEFFRMEPSVELFLYEFLDIPKTSAPASERLEVCVEVEGGGQGSAYMAAEIYYNMTDCSTKTDNALLLLSYKILQEFAHRLKIQFNLTYLGGNEDTGMGIFEVNPLSGFCPIEELFTFKSHPNVYDVVVNDNGLVVIYFNKFMAESIVVFDFFRCEQIFGPQPVEAKAQLYYDNSVMARIMYETRGPMPLKATGLKWGNVGNPCGPFGCQTNSATGRYVGAKNHPLISTLMSIALVVMATGVVY